MPTIYVSREVEAALEKRKNETGKSINLIIADFLGVKFRDKRVKHHLDEMKIGDELIIPRGENKAFSGLEKAIIKFNTTEVERQVIVSYENDRAVVFCRKRIY